MGSPVESLASSSLTAAVWGLQRLERHRWRSGQATVICSATNQVTFDGCLCSLHTSGKIPVDRLGWRGAGGEMDQLVEDQVGLL